MDDTLYDELSYVKSGFRAVCQYLHNEFKIPYMACYDLMLNELQINGRGRIFDVALATFGVLSKERTRKCVSIYRMHSPNIRLNLEAINCFKRFKHYPMYIVTDGNKIAQANKVEALGVDRYVKKVFITHRYGRNHSKPSPYCFLKIADLEKAYKRDIVYIGDNPHKDFVGIKSLGFKTIRLLKGEHRNAKVSKRFDAQYSIQSLDELRESLLANL